MQVSLREGMDINTVTKAKGQLIINSKICQFLAITCKSGGGRALMFNEFSKVVPREFTGNII